MRINETIYLDHHATTPVDPQVLAEMLPYFSDSFGNPHSTDHAVGWSSARAVEVAVDKIADLIGADQDEIVFTSGATEANNLALSGLANGALAAGRRRILLCETDHKSALAVGRALERSGFCVVTVATDRGGRLNLDRLRELMREDVLLFSISLVNSEIGTIQDIAAIAAIARSQGVLVHCDAAQAPCAMDLGALTQSVDLLSLSAHKMYGPKGVGALYIRRDLQRYVAPIIHGGGQQRDLRSGTLPTPLCVGFGAAAGLLQTSGAIERQRIAALRDLFVSELRTLPWQVELNGHQDRRHPGNANMRFCGFAAEEILGALQPRLAASTGSACTSGISEPSHVLRAIGLSDKEAAASIRFCIGRHTKESDAYRALELISETLKKLQNSLADSTAG